MASGKVIKAQDLVYTTNYVEGDMPIGDVKSWFQSQLSVVSLGVLAGEGKFGLISRSHLSQLLINQAQQAEFLKKPVAQIMITTPLTVEAAMEIDELVMRLLSEKAGHDEFFHDIIVHDHNTFVGLISARDLLVNHVENLSHKLTAMEAQQAALIQKNKELFASSFRLGQMEGQFKIIFEKVPLPLALFSDDGKLIVANPRFAELLDYPLKQLEVGTPFRKLFEGGFPTIYQHAVAAWESGDTSAERLFRNLTARLHDGRPLQLGSYVELMPDGRHVLISVADMEEVVEVGQSGMHEEDPEESIQVVARPRVVPEAQAARSTGKITQAIRTKLTSSNALGLARTVASNLIDREQELDRLMKKVEAIIKVAEQVEHGGSSADDSGSVESKIPLKGDLSQFSVIDLSQVLVQGNKTGQLSILGEPTSGQIFFYCGAIVHADLGDGRTGVHALPALLKLKSGQFQFNFDVSSPAISIEGDAMGILMDACRMADEG